ncbi:ribosome recycling factor [Janibacter sp. HTCC2649]|uniref:ribosome recycling factor n=1 Tax=Janibacter sp. HTCC2649 TaxID=313589 RepID=UPI0000670FE9|nr:ribosome recycling factor [Janibacter sp. HTCC2649]EAP97769.1 ribosome recycling factor [Janibacter sp. HTCC2649]
MIDDTLLEAEEKMDKAVEVAKDNFAAIRTGRAHPSMFNKVIVDYYGAPTPLQQLASFQTPEARTILISPFDKGAMNNIEKALRDADLGVNPSNDGNIIRCILPQLTEERRKEYIKMARGQAEDAKVAIRNVRRTAKESIERLVKDGDVGEDEGSRAEKDLESTTKKYVDTIDEVLKGKETELLEV